MKFRISDIPRLMIPWTLLLICLTLPWDYMASNGFPDTSKWDVAYRVSHLSIGMVWWIGGSCVSGLMLAAGVGHILNREGQ